MKQDNPKHLDELLKTITPPKDVDVEGSELLDCEGDENEDLEEDLEDDQVMNSKISEVFLKATENKENEKESIPNETPKLSNMCENPEINRDVEFLDKLQVLIESCETSKLFTPHKSS